LLPPSEGKTPPATGDPLDLTALSSPDLNPKRKQVLGALKKVSKRRDALTALGVGASLTEDVARNVTIDFQPCAPALLTYTGVLYEAMGAADLVAAAEAVTPLTHTVTAAAGTWQPAGGGPAVDDPDFTALGNLEAAAEASGTAAATTEY
ncbi:peroxide stress protein YaaA, partial [Geobacillus sp. MMMUD3]|nr:peroxide stress protein YaaA [Geobacillus sp. MMMUD3]